ncbi:MAG: hypothetical protein V3T86_13480 [Planctomycetota bacterium]
MALVCETTALAQTAVEKALAESIEAAGPLIAGARKADRKSKDARDTVKEAVRILRPRVKMVRKGCWTTKKVTHLRAFAQTWNEMITVAHFHGLKPKGGYILERISFAYGRLIGAVPVSTRWRWKWPRTDQLAVEFRILRPDEKSVMRHIKVWRYKWNTVYSGVGGENAKKLARAILEIERDNARGTGRKASKTVGVRKLNRHFPRAHYYFAQTFDDDLQKDVTSRNYYFKDKTARFCVEVIELKGKPSDDQILAWRVKDKDPELRAFLDSIKRNPAWD